MIDEIKSANIQAMKDKNTTLRSIYSVLINKYMQAEIEARTTQSKVGDDEVIRIIQKTIKELDEESANYAKVGNDDEVQHIETQKKALEIYLPQMLGEDKIKEIILSLPDKSIPVVMRHFKENFGATVDLKLVNQVLRSL